MTQRFDWQPDPTAGNVVTYDQEEGFRTPENPVVPFASGTDEAAVSATRRMLDAAAEGMGREINWLRVTTGDVAREGDGDPLPEETVQAFRRFRVGLHGPLATTRTDALALETTLRRRLDLMAAVSRHTNLRLNPSPPTRVDLDVTLFRDVSAVTGTAVEDKPASDEENGLGEFLRDASGGGHVPDSPTGYTISQITREATEALVDESFSYAFDRNQDTVTLAHQGDLRDASEGSFIVWAREYIADEFGDSVVDEETFREEYDDYPEDELVVFERRTADLCRDLAVDPGEYDVLVAPALGGTYLSAVARGVAGESGDAAAVGVGDGRIVAAARPEEQGPDPDSGTAPMSLLLAGCLLFDYLGWEDAATALRTAVSTTLAECAGPQAGVGSHSCSELESASAFADAVVSRLDEPRRESGAGGVRSTPTERASIQQAISTLYNAVFADELTPEEVELNQLMSEDEEADVSLPEVGINFYYWRRWSVERRLEVLLHELAHVEEEDDERDHGDEFYDRLVELTEIAAEWEQELEEVFDEPIDFDRLRQLVVDSAHEETIETDIDDVESRKQWLRQQFSIK